MEYKLKQIGDLHDLVIEGLKEGAEFLKHWPERDVEDVLIFPGLYHSCQNDASFWQGIGSQLYDLYQTDRGGNIKEGDTFILEERGWKWYTVSVHILPVEGTYPSEWKDYTD